MSKELSMTLYLVQILTGPKCRAAILLKHKGNYKKLTSFRPSKILKLDICQIWIGVNLTVNNSRCVF